MSSEYPTIQQVETADRKQLADWYRHLPKPGTSTELFHNHALSLKIEKEEMVVRDRIIERLNELGGFAIEMTKRTGWLP